MSGPSPRDGATSSLETMRIDDLLRSVAAKQPAPGGGAVASVVAALACALGRMVLGFSKPRAGDAGHEDLLRSAAGRLEALSTRAIELGDEDAAATERLLGLWKLPPDDPHRRATWDAAVRDAIAAPRELLGLTVEILETAESLAGRSNAHLRSDLAIAAVLAEAAARAAIWNIRVNVPQLGDAGGAAVLEAAERVGADVRARCARIEASCA